MATIINESNTYDDILQGDFSDEYKNLTVKHIMGLSWASTYCSSARFIIKTDDDSVFNIYAVLYFIQTRSSVEPDNFLVGHIYGGNPHRGEDSKWYVSREEYPEEIYNPYVSGGLYLTTPETAERLVNAAKTIPFFWIDDAFVTGILRKRSGVGISSFAGIVIRVEKQLFYYCLTEMETKNLTCPFSVSENGGIINLFVRFMKSLKRCYRGGCSINPPKHLLKIMIQEEIVGSSFNNLFKPYIRY